MSPLFNALGTGATACRTCSVGTYTHRYDSVAPGALACGTCAEGEYLQSIGAIVTWSAGEFGIITKKNPCNPCITCKINGTTVNRKATHMGAVWLATGVDLEKNA